jgi:hypothetical protein
MKRSLRGATDADVIQIWVPDVRKGNLININRIKEIQGDADIG